MRERISKIIEMLIREMTDLPDPFGGHIEALSRKLLDAGYTQGEINKAVEWVITNFDESQGPLQNLENAKNMPSLRLLSAEEMNFFSPEAYGYLIQVQALSIVSPLQIEQIIERCFLMGLSRIETEDIKTVVSQILLGKEPGGLGSENTGRSEVMYHPGNDKIN
ncbi:MAG: DUF494 family protein [Calditrichia bacterium]